MSTIVAVKKPGKIAIGADTMTKFGRSYESAELVANHSKIVRVGESLLAYVGHASFGLVLESYFSTLDEPPTLDSPRAIFEVARAMHPALKEHYFLNAEGDEDDSFEDSRLDCLIANASGIFGLYGHRSVLEYTCYHAFGSGMDYALGAMATLFERSDDPGEIARAGLEAAAKFDDRTGAPFEIHIVGR